MYCFKYTGSYKELVKKFNESIARFNNDYPNNDSPLTGSIKEEKIEIGLERTSHDKGYYFESNIVNRNNVLRIEGNVKSNYKINPLYAILKGLFMLLLLSFKLLVWLFLKLIGKSFKPNKYRKLHIFMTEYLGCEVSGSMEVEDEIDKIKTYLETSPNFTGELDIVSAQVVDIVFNKDFYLHIIFSNQMWEAYISMNNEFTHWHPNNNEVFADIRKFVEEEVFIIEYRSLPLKFIGSSFTPNVRFLPASRYKANEKKYLNKKNIRIYTGKQIYQ